MDVKHKVERLRKLYNDNGIYCLSALATFCSLDEVTGVERLAKTLRQSSSCTHQWIVMFELFGLITREEAARGRPRPMVLTPDGLALREALDGLLSQILPAE